MLYLRNMSAFKKYRLNPETLLYEIEKVSARSRVLKAVMLVAASFALSVVYLWLFTSVLGLKLPKTVLLERANAKWISKMELMNRQLNAYDQTLNGLENRDDEIYRNIFGMNEISPEVRNAGFGGVNRYAYLDNIQNNSALKKTTIRLDILTKKSYVQSKSFDEVAAVSKTAGDMASCIPAIPPIVPDPSRYKMSSPFGYRTDPFTGASRMHTGLDFAMKIGNPVYATGDGVVESVKFEFFGYGNSITIKHGFGYETIYAHLNSVKVIEGMKVKRGDCIGESGKSGRSSGPHLHYEVVYKGRKVNPANYLDMSMSVQEYSDMLRMRESESGMPSSMRHSFSVRHR